jgi:hypothetical protein
LHICYFCHKPLIHIKDLHINYEKHYACYSCPRILNPAYNLEVWKVPYCIIVSHNDNTKIHSEYIYFHNSQLWLHIFYFESGAFLDIKDNNNKHLLRKNFDMNLLDCTPFLLENKIKTWLIFS